MAIKKFEEFINNQTSAFEREIDRKDQLATWQQHLDEFYRVIASYLKPYLDNQKIKIEFADLDIAEDRIGIYTTQKATIHLGPHTLALEPIGMMIIGAAGRVDLTGPYGKVRFVLLDETSPPRKAQVKIVKDGDKARQEQALNKPSKLTWKIATNPPQVTYLPLTEDSFQEALMAVTNG